MSHLSIGLAQLACRPLDREQNLVAAATAVADAAGRGARLVVLPELATSGYLLDRGALWDQAESTLAPGPALTALQATAARHGVTVVAGFPEREEDRLYNSAVVLSPSGSIAAVYRKLHLFGLENDVFAPGDLGLPIAEVDGLRVAPLICFDLRFPEVLRILAVRGVDLIAVPTAWVPGFDADTAEAEIGQVRTARVLANLNSVPIACAAQVGASGSLEFLGSSLLLDPYGRALTGPAGRTEPGVFVADLDLDLGPAARRRGYGLSAIAQRRTDVYDDLLGYRPPITTGAAPS